MKKFLSLFLSFVMLLTLVCSVPVSATATENSSQADIYPPPTEYIAGPDTFKSDGSSGEVNYRDTAYISAQEATEIYNKYLIADFDLDFNTFGVWSILSIYLDNKDCNNWGNGLIFRISGPDSFKGNATGFIDNPSGVGLIVKRPYRNDAGTPVTETVAAAPLAASTTELVNTIYRVIIKRVIGDTDTTVDFYMFPKGTDIPTEPTVSFTYANDVYGKPSTSIAFASWSITKSAASNVKLYNYNVGIHTGPLSIDDPALVPTKTVTETETVASVGKENSAGKIYISDEEAKTIYDEYLVADLTVDFADLGGWANARLWIDSVEVNEWDGFNLFIGGNRTFDGRAASFNVGTTGKVGVILYGSLSGAKEVALDACSLGITEAEFCSKEYRIIVKRVRDDTNTKVKFYFFPSDSEIPDEPMFDVSYTNEQCGLPATSVSFTTYDRVSFEVNDIKLYNYDVDITPYSDTQSIDDPTIVPTSAIADSTTYNGTAGHVVVHNSYLSAEEVKESYSENLISDFNISFNSLGTWRYVGLWLDSKDTNFWGGFSFRICGSTFFKNNIDGYLENPTGVGMLLCRSVSDSAEVIGAYDFGIDEATFQKTSYRMILKRTVGATDTSVEFYMFPADDDIPAEPMFKFSYTNEEYGGISTSVSFSTWEQVNFTISNMRLFNYDVAVEPFFPYLKRGFETTPEDNIVVETSVITRTSTDGTRWLDTKDEPADYDYSFAVVGDTQYINRHNPEVYPKICDWIIDNSSNKKIKFVAGLGDITDTSTVEEWTRAQEQINRLNDVVPYSIVRGNHDKIADFTTYFPYENYADTYGGSFNGTMLNTWQELVIGRNKYLIMGLDYGADDAELEWANEVIAAHPDHSVIITTHGYLDSDGTLLKDELVTNDGFNDGDDMWEKLIKKHGNITMVLCGHIYSQDIVVAKSVGEKGNTVTQILVNPQILDQPSSADRPAGMVCMLYFSDGGRKVEVEYYSTVKQQYFKDINQFNFEIDVVDNNDIGDINGDGFISATDIADVRKCLLGTINKAYYFDVTGDGKIDIIDFIRVKKLSIGAKTE